MSFWRLYYHIVWTTKNRLPLITSELEPDFYRYLSAKINEIGCIPHALGGMEDHIHFVVSIPPRMSISEFVKKVKGSSSRFANQRGTFAWQRSFGVFSLGAKQLPMALEYVENQKTRHKNKNLISWLEVAEDASE